MATASVRPRSTTPRPAWSPTWARLSGDTCGGSGSAGPVSSYGWAVSDNGRAAVGTAYVDVDGDGTCELHQARDPALPVDRQGHAPARHQRPPTSRPAAGCARTRSPATARSRWHANLSNALAWINGGPRIDLTKKFGGVDANAVNRDGTRVAMDTVRTVEVTSDGNHHTVYLPTALRCVELEDRRAHPLTGPAVVQEPADPAVLTGSPATSSTPAAPGIRPGSTAPTAWCRYRCST